MSDLLDCQRLEDDTKAKAEELANRYSDCEETQEELINRYDILVSETPVL